jgi:hypothetical protein
MAKKKQIRVKDTKLKEFLKNGGREGSKKDFFELLKRVAKPLKP